jgi:hypothetical protein
MIINKLMSDRKQLEEGEARVLYATWQFTGNKVMTEERKAWLNKKYGYGAANRIQQYMMMIHAGDLV